MGPTCQSKASIHHHHQRRKVERAQAEGLNISSLPHFFNTDDEGLATKYIMPFAVHKKEQIFSRMVANQLLQKVIKCHKQIIQKSVPCKITPKWVVKEKELELATINMANKQVAPFRRVTWSMTRVQTLSNNLEEVQTEFDHGDSFTQSTGGRGSFSLRALSLIHPSQSSIYMADDDGESDQNTEGNHNNNSGSLELFDAVKQNSLKIKLFGEWLKGDYEKNYNS